MISENDALKFLAKVRQAADHECWLWTGAVQKNGYGRARIGPAARLAHRVAFELATGSLDPGQCVCHRCDVRLCCNPAHLFAGTHADNERDKIAKGRVRYTGTPKKLSPELATEIRRLHAEDGVGMTELARRFGVRHENIRRVIRRLNYRHVK